MRQSWKKRQFILKVKFSLPSPLSMLKSLVSTVVLALCWACRRSGKGICTLCSRRKTWVDLCWHHKLRLHPSIKSPWCWCWWQWRLWWRLWRWRLWLIAMFNSWQLSRMRSTFSFRYRVYKITYSQREIIFDHCPQVMITSSQFCFQEVIYKREVKH